MNEYKIIIIGLRVRLSSLNFHAKWLSKSNSKTLRPFYMNEFINPLLSEISTLNPYC